MDNGEFNVHGSVISESNVVAV